MKVYLAIKYHPDHSNRPTIEALSEQLTQSGHEVACVVRDVEKWGAKTFTAAELMRLSFELLDASDLVLIEFSEKGVGLGIEAGYAHARGIPIVTIARSGSEISNTLLGVSREVIFYDQFGEIVI